MPLDLNQPQKSLAKKSRLAGLWGNERPHALALGTAIGVFVGVTPSMPIQSLIAVLCAALFRANRVSALAGVWINNPFTIVPLYSGSYALGCVLLDQPMADLSFDFLTEGTGTWLVQAETLWGVFAGILWPLLVGSMVIAVGLGVLSYAAVLGAIVVWRRREGKKHEP